MREEPMRRIAAVALLVAFVVAPVGAQTAGAHPKRPELPFTRDTNDAHAYNELGQLKLSLEPRVAADAFYWAARLGPHAASAFYGQHTALLLADPASLRHYVDRDRKKPPSAEMLRIDSLRDRALLLDPFLYRKYEQLVLRRYFSEVAARRSPAAYRSERTVAAVVAFNRWVATADPGTQGWAAYCEGRFADALQSYAAALKKGKETVHFRTERGGIFYLTGQFDSALVELRLALDELRKKDSEKLVRLYTSKALLEHSVAKIHEQLGDPASAREAYGRALEEDLAFYPAHVNLGVLALQEGDTATGLNELDLAVQIKGDEPMLRVFYGYLLSRVKRYPEAEVQLAKAIELEPFYARPYQFLGLLYEAQRKRSEAIRQYEAYLARAAQNDAPRQEIAQRLEALRLGAGGPGT
jgi:tetratricopeptide (TPR) repeat protein